MKAYFDVSFMLVMVQPFAMSNSNSTNKHSANIPNKFPITVNHPAPNPLNEKMNTLIKLNTTPANSVDMQTVNNFVMGWICCRNANIHTGRIIP